MMPHNGRVGRVGAALQSSINTCPPLLRFPILFLFSSLFLPPQTLHRTVSHLLTTAIRLILIFSPPMSSPPTYSRTLVGSSESQVNVLGYCSQKYTLLEPQKQLKTPKSKNIQLHTRTPIYSDRVRHVRYFIREPSISPETAKRSTPFEKALRSTYADPYSNDYGYHYPGAGSPEKPQTRQVYDIIDTDPHPSSQQEFDLVSPEAKADFIYTLSVVKELFGPRHQPATVTHSTPRQPACPVQLSTPPPVIRCAPDAPLRPQGCTTPRFEALSCANFVPPLNSPSSLSRRAFIQDGAACYSLLRHPISPLPVQHFVTRFPLAPLQPLTPLQPVGRFRSRFSPTPSPSSSPLCHRQASLASIHSPIRFRLAHSPRPSESFSRAKIPSQPLIPQSAPTTLCPQDDDTRFHQWVIAEKARLAGIERWIPSPDSCESAVSSPSASSIADSWSARSTSIATVSSGSPLAYRVPIIQRQCNFLSALVGKRIWRFSSADKEAYLNTLDRDDPDRLLQTPPTRTTSIHNWIADIPTPQTPPKQQPSRLKDLSPLLSPLFSPFFSSSSGSSKDVDPQAHGLAATSPPHRSSPVWHASPSSQSSSDFWPIDSRFPLGRVSPASSSSRSLSAASPSTQASPALQASPSSIASRPSPITLRSLLAVSLSPLPVNKYPAALSSLQISLAAGSPQHSSSVIHSSHASPLRDTAPVALTATHSLASTQPRCRKRKLVADASPAPVRFRPAVTRFEPPIISRFSPVLPDSLPSFPHPCLSIPGSFPTAIHFKPRVHVTPSNTPSPGFTWKTVAGIAVGGFALGCLATRYLF